MTTQIKTKKTKNNYTNQNPLEILKGLGTGVGDSLVDDLGLASPKTAWESMFSGASSGSTESGINRNSGELIEGHEINLGKKHKSEIKETQSAPAIDYTREFIDSGHTILRENQQILQSQIREILIELKKISETSSEIAMEFSEATIEQRIENPGEYHVNFFQWMLSVVRAARARIEDSGVWLNTMKSKKGQKNYWAMFKKHGTTFGLSNERVVATQTG